MIEELLKILVDCPVLMKEYIKTVLQNHGEDLKLICQNINPYHKFLDSLVMLWSTNKKEGHDVENLEQEIDDCLKTYEDQIDPMHVIFLFRQMEYYDGIKSFSQQLHLNQELLGLYIEKKHDDRIVQLCIEHGQSERNLWLQALTYF